MGVLLALSGLWLPGVPALMMTASAATEGWRRTCEMWGRRRTMIEALMVPAAVMRLPWMLHRKIRRVAASIYRYAVRVGRVTIGRIAIGRAVIRAEASAQPAY